MKDLVSRTVQQLQPSGIRAMFNLASSMEGVINLALGEPDFITPEPIMQAAVRAMAEGKTHYTANAGTLELRRRIAATIHRESGLSLDPESQIIVTVGGMSSLYIGLRTVLNPGDEVLLPSPGWTNYEGQIELAGGRVVRVPMRKEDGFTPRIEDVEKRITPRTKLIMINSPANPTGAVCSLQTLEGIAELARSHDFLVLSDEVYKHMVWDENRHHTIAALPGMFERTITVNSFSKAFAMTGWRIGYTFARQEIISGMVKLQEDVTSCNHALSQEAALTALEREGECTADLVRTFSERRQILTAQLRECSQLSFIPPQGAFYLFLNISDSGLSSQEFALRLLKEKKVCLVPGTAFGPDGEGFVRISYAAATEKLLEAGRRIIEFMEESR